MRHTFASQALIAGENAMRVTWEGHRDGTTGAPKYGRWPPSTIPGAGAQAAAVWVPKSAI
ncbi:hypothetical protein VK66_20520 [Stenotrophomonas maltophilia]|nr:hypothetical protein CEQ03_05515 [Stenotrophomonas maltophilia]KOO74839.1 hypothetical protein VK66_20520 [Stenotrophomonas maltophilia]